MLFEGGTEGFRQETNSAGLSHGAYAYRPAGTNFLFCSR